LLKQPHLFSAEYVKNYGKFNMSYVQGVDSPCVLILWIQQKKIVELKNRPIFVGEYWNKDTSNLS